MPCRVSCQAELQRVSLLHLQICVHDLMAYDLPDLMGGIEQQQSEEELTVALLEVLMVLTPIVA